MSNSFQSARSSSIAEIWTRGARCRTAKSMSRAVSAFDPLRTFAPVRASGPVEPASALAASETGRGYPRTGLGESIMQRVVVLACAALALGMFASPLGAQQTPSKQPMPEAAQNPPAPEAEPLPPPPPFPPMPSARPSHRWVDMGDRHARRVRHHAAPTHHRATRTQHRRTHAHHRPAHKARLVHFSHRTIRSSPRDAPTRHHAAQQLPAADEARARDDCPSSRDASSQDGRASGAAPSSNAVTETLAA